MTRMMLLLMLWVSVAGLAIAEQPDARPNEEAAVSAAADANAKMSEAPAPASPLNDLAWLVGQWTDAGGDSAISTTVVWTKNKSFLSYSFKVAPPGAADLEGTQVIGWDPAAGTIRSWMFDSDGGFGEGTWSKKGNRWLIKFKQVLPDGRKASATNIYTIIDHDTITWQSIGREVDGQFMPNIGPVKVIRKGKS